VEKPEPRGGRNRTERSTLSTKQRRAIVAILAGSSRSEAAKQAGVARSTVQHWLRSNPAFFTEIEAGTQSIIDDARSELRTLALSALDVLRGLLADPSAPAPARLRAALEILTSLRILAPDDPVFPARDLSLPIGVDPGLIEDYRAKIKAKWEAHQAAQMAAVVEFERMPNPCPPPPFPPQAAPGENGTGAEPVAEPRRRRPPGWGGPEAEPGLY
jgi:hypothetical protein